jgi:hypothetical protein
VLLSGIVATANACAQGAGPPGFAAPWVSFVSNERMAGAFDPTRLARRGDTVDVWLRFHYAEPQPFPRNPKRFYHAMDVHQTVHCESGRTRDIRMLVLGAAADSVAGYTPPTPLWVSIPEHALSERVLARLCTALRAAPG